MGEWVNERKNTGNEWFFWIDNPSLGNLYPKLCLYYFLPCDTFPDRLYFRDASHASAPKPSGWVWNRSKRTVCKHKTEAQMLLILHTGVTVLSRQCSACVHSVGNTIHTVSTASTIPEHGVVTKPVTSLRGQTVCAHEQEGRWSPLTREFKD